jgi:uncharacterized protein
MKLNLSGKRDMTMGNKFYKIIIDSNIWISFLIGQNLKGLQNLIDSQVIKIVTCEEQYQELSEVFNKPKIRKYFTKEQVTEFFELLDECSEKQVLTTKSNICRDLKDNYLVSLAIDSKADFLLSGDKDLLVLKMINNTTVLNFNEFDKILV